MNNSQNLMVILDVESTLYLETMNLQLPEDRFVKVRKLDLYTKVVTNYHCGKQGIEIRIDSLSGDGSRSWIKISNGLNKFVRDSTETTRVLGDDENCSANTGQPVIQESRIVPYSQKETDEPTAKAKPKMEQISNHERKWIDIEPCQEKYMPEDARSYPVSKRMVLSLRHGTAIPRQEDGQIELWRLKADSKPVFPNNVCWSIGLWTDHLQKGGGRKKRFQFCTIFSGSEILDLRAIQVHSGENPVVPSLLDNVLIPDIFFEFVYHVGCYFNMHSIIASGLLAGSNIHGRDRPTVFFAAVDPMDKSWVDKEKHDLTQPRHAADKQIWKVNQDAVY